MGLSSTISFFSISLLLNAFAIASEIESVGGSLNAYTSRENTFYYAKVMKEDLELAIDKIKETRSVDLVVFGHMHHHLKRGKGIRNTFKIDKKRSIAYLNTASVPRKGVDVNEKLVSHFSWVEFNDGELTHVSHRWYCSDASIAYQEDLYNIQ